MSAIARRLWVAFAVAGLLVLGCKADTTGLDTLTVTELTTLASAGSELVLCDANNEETRIKFGVIPGAQLLTNYRDYDPAVELPADKAQRLVFYCHSEMCGAAAGAARKAVAAGHTDVLVMPEGIKGWVAAGGPVEQPPAG